jgi:hypothetical protein
MALAEMTIQSKFGYSFLISKRFNHDLEHATGLFIDYTFKVATVAPGSTILQHAAIVANRLAEAMSQYQVSGSMLWLEAQRLKIFDEINWPKIGYNFVETPKMLSESLDLDIKDTFDLAEPDEGVGQDLSITWIKKNHNLKCIIYYGSHLFERATVADLMKKYCDYVEKYLSPNLIGKNKI